MDCDIAEPDFKFLSKYFKNKNIFFNVEKKSQNYIICKVNIFNCSFLKIRLWYATEKAFLLAKQFISPCSDV